MKNKEKILDKLIGRELSMKFKNEIVKTVNDGSKIILLHQPKVKIDDRRTNQK